MKKIYLVAQTDEIRESLTTLKTTPFTSVLIGDLAALMVDAYFGTTDWEDGDDEAVAESEIRKVIAGEYGHFLAEASLAVIDENQQPIAAIAAALIENQPTVLFLFTSAGHKRKGLGEHLLRACASELKAASYAQVALFVSSDNPAINLYQKVGFKPNKI